jgi:hypothetical protein
VLEFDEFMKIEGCKTKERHLFVGSKKKGGEEMLDTVRCVYSPPQSIRITDSSSHDFYQTPTAVMASIYLKKIDKATSTVSFTSTQVELDLRTSDNKRYQTSMPFFGEINPETSTFNIMGTKLEMELKKTDGSSWPVLKKDDPRTGEILQIGRAGRV